jgi:hypothetical protein
VVKAHDARALFSKAYLTSEHGRFFVKPSRPIRHPQPSLDLHLIPIDFYPVMREERAQLDMRCHTHSGIRGIVISCQLFWSFARRNAFCAELIINLSRGEGFVSLHTVGLSVMVFLLAANLIIRKADCFSCMIGQSSVTIYADACIHWCHTLHCVSCHLRPTALDQI